jgi:pimeloyl-ACP methyl ester carboxylesterase
MSSPALLLIHGYPFDHTLWDAVVPRLDSDIQAFAPDLRGFDGQPPGPKEPALEHMADDLAQLLAAHQIMRAVVAGMSMGGYVALAFAERYPDRVTGLGLISSQIWADSDDARNGRRAMIERVQREGAGVAAEAVIPKLFAPQNAHRPELTRAPRLAAERAGVPGICWALEAMARRPDRSRLFTSFSVPVLVLHGAQDKFIDIARAREMARLPRNSRYVEVPDAGHATPLEAPNAVAQALNELVGRSGVETRKPH